VAERAEALARVPDPPGDYSVAVMELGALVCTARAPRCDACPVADGCRWRLAGWPPAGASRRAQPYAGTDREVRGRLLAVLRASDGAVGLGELDVVWPDPVQRARALAGLVADGLAEQVGDASYRLPL
jgi:A/G-specific adenine glycosylase